MSVTSYRPHTMQEALELLAKGKLTIFAGGTDLMIRKRRWQGATRPFTQDVLFIQQIEELRHINSTVDGWSIGAAVTQQEIVDHPDLPDYLRRVVGQMATPAIRHSATLGGNIVNAASVADTLPALIAADAKVVLKSLSNERQLLVRDFITGKYKTQMGPDELLTEILIPRLPVTRFGYKKLGNRMASILSKLSVLVLWLGNENDNDNDNDNDLHQDKAVRIAIGAVNDTVIRAPHLESQISALLTAEKLQPDRAELLQILKEYRLLMQAVDDKRSTKQYKETVTIQLIKQFLEENHEQ